MSDHALILSDASTRPNHHVTALRVSPEAWDTALPALEGATFFDSARWQEAFRFKVTEVHYVHFLYKNKIIAGFSCGCDDKNGIRRFLSPFTAAFGGILAVPHLAFSLWHETVGALLDYCAQIARGGPHEIRYIRRSRCILGANPQEAEDFSLMHRKFSLEKTQCDFFFDLKNDITLENRYASMLRKVERENIFTFIPSDAEEFIAFRNFVVAQQKKDITVSDEEIRSGSALFPHDMNFYKVSYQNTTVAVLLADALHKECSIGRNWFVDKTADKKNATLFLLSQWIKHLRRGTVRFVGFGSSANTANPLNKNLIFFKERFRPILYDAKKTYVFSA